MAGPRYVFGLSLKVHQLDPYIFLRAMLSGRKVVPINFKVSSDTPRSLSRLGSVLKAACEGEPSGSPRVVVEAVSCIARTATGNSLDTSFKVKSDMSAILSVKRAYDRGENLPLGGCKDPELAAGVLKLYLASLPEPLLTFRLYDSFLALAVISDRSRRTAALSRLVQGLPVEVQSTLRVLLPLLARVLQRGPSVSKTTTALFAPLFLRLRADESARLAGDLSKAESITETLILEHEVLLGKLSPPAQPSQERSVSPSSGRTSTSMPQQAGRPGTPALAAAGPLSSASSGAASRDDVGPAQQSQFSVYAAAGVTAAAGSGPLASPPSGGQGPHRGPLSNFTNTLQRHGGGQAKPLSPTFGKKSAAAAAGASAGAPQSPKLGAGLRHDEKTAVITRLGDSIAVTAAALFLPLDGTLVEHVARCIGSDALERARSCFPMSLSRRPGAAGGAPAVPSAQAAAHPIVVSAPAASASAASLIFRGPAPAAASLCFSASEGSLQMHSGSSASLCDPPPALGGAGAVDEGSLMSAAAECLSIIAVVPAASSADLAGLLVEKASLKRTLRAFDIAFSNAHDRLPERAEKEPLRPAYARLARVKRRIERLEAAAGFGAGAAAAPQLAGDAAAQADSVVMRITSTLAGGRRVMC